MDGEGQSDIIYLNTTEIQINKSPNTPFQECCHCARLPLVHIFQLFHVDVSSNINKEVSENRSV